MTWCPKCRKPVRIDYVIERHWKPDMTSICPMSGKVPKWDNPDIADTAMCDN